MQNNMLISIPMQKGDCVCTALARMVGIDTADMAGYYNMPNCHLNKPQPAREFKGDFREYFNLDRSDDDAF